MSEWKRGLVSVACIFLFLLLSGCYPAVTKDQIEEDQAVKIQSGHWIGQSFVATYQGLSGIEVYITPKESNQRLTLSLYSDAQSKQIITQSTISLNGAKEPGYYRFSFPALKKSSFMDYFFEIEVGDGPTQSFAASAGDTYVNGGLYLDHAPQNKQLTFNLVYDPIQLGIGLLRDSINWVWFLLIGCVAFILPGWGILSFLLDNSWAWRTWIEKIALAGGVGLALYPVMMLWAKLFKWSPGIFFNLIPVIIAASYLIWKNRGSFSKGIHWNHHFQLSSIVADLTCMALLALIFGTRFWVIRGGDVPLWGDSYQHTMIAQLIADHKGLFDSWQPYVPYETLTVQYGFPAKVALWMWLTGMKSPQATLVFGQWLNGVAVLALYPLAMYLFRGNRWAGNASLLIGGLLSQMPSFYVNWGRYAQLDGQAILPIALCLILYWLEISKMDWKQVLVNGLVIAGMLLGYYRMAFYYVTFIPIALGFFWLHGVPERSFRCWKSIFTKLVLVAMVSLIFILPWLPNLSGSNLSASLENGIVKQSNLQGVINDYRSWANYQDYVPIGLVFLGLLSFGISLVAKHWEISGLILWLGLVSAIRAGSLIHLPGANLIQSYAVMISLYIFVSLIGAWLLGTMIVWGKNHFSFVGTLFAVMMFLGLALYGANHQRKILNPRTYAIVTRPDLRAMDWIRNNTSPQSVFLVEGFRIYNGESAVGSDAGWWIPIFTSRQNTMPPQYALVNERPISPDYSTKVVDLVKGLEGRSLTDPSSRAILCQWGVTHIFVGQQQGLASIEKIQLYPPDIESEDGTIRLVYAQDRVRIYAILSGFCQNTLNK